MRVAQPVLAEDPAVVGGEDHVGVGVDVVGPQRPDDPLDHVVDAEQRAHAALVVRGQRRDVGLGHRVGEGLAERRRLVGDVGLVEVGVPRQRGVREAVGVARRRHRRRSLDLGVGLDRHGVRRVGRDVEEERLADAARLADRPHRQAGVDVGRVVLGRAAVGLRHAVVVDRHAVVVVRARIDAAVVVGPAGGHLGGVALAGLVEVLADVDRPVAGALQPQRHDLVLLEDVVAALGEEVPLDAVVVGVLARVVRRPRRAAQRVADHAGGERRAAPRDQAPGLGHHVHRPEVLVVGHDHHDVVACLLAGGRGRRQRSGQHGDRGDRDPGACHDTTVPVLLALCQQAG